MRNAIRYAAWHHIMLAGYLWIIASIPLGNWNLQKGERLLPALLNGHGVRAGDLGGLAFVSLPALFCWMAYRRSSIWFAGMALLVDTVWLWMQIRTWWVPYISGAPSSWQIAYARGPTTKLLPSLGNHVAPDGMHFVMHVLLAAAIVVGVIGVRQLATQKSLTLSADVQSRRTRG